MSEDLRDIYSRSPEIFKRLRKEIDKVIVGQDTAIEQLLVSLLAGAMPCWRAIQAWPKPSWSRPPPPV